MTTDTSRISAVWTRQKYRFEARQDDDLCEYDYEDVYQDYSAPVPDGPPEYLPVVIVSLHPDSDHAIVMHESRLVRVPLSELTVDDPNPDSWVLAHVRRLISQQDVPLTPDSQEELPCAPPSQPSLPEE